MTLAQKIDKRASRLDDVIRKEWGKGVAAVIEDATARVIKADESTATPGFQIKPGLDVQPGDLVWYFHRGAIKLVLDVLNRNALFATGMWVNVRDYGAVGNGAVDDAGAFEDASAVAGIGGRLYVPAGTYLLSSSWAPLAGQRIVGESIEGTILKRGNTTLVGLVLLVDGAHASDLTVDGSYTELGNHLNYDLRLGDDCIAERVRVINFSRLGMAVTGSRASIRDCQVIAPGIGDNGTSGGDGYFGIWSGLFGAKDMEVINTLVRDCHGNAIFVGADTERLRIQGCTFLDNHLLGDVTAGGQICIQVPGVVITDNVFDATNGGSRTYGIELGDGASDVVIGNNVITNHGAMGIQIHPGCHDIQVVGNVVKNSGQGTNTTPGIRVRDTVEEVVISGNRFYDDQGTKTQTYGIHLEAGAEHVLMVGNNLRGNLTGAIDDDSGGADIVNQHNLT